MYSLNSLLLFFLVVNDVLELSSYEILCRFGSLLACETFHADVHAGNLWLLRDGRIGFLDFGMFSPCLCIWHFSDDFCFVPHHLASYVQCCLENKELHK